MRPAPKSLTPYPTTPMNELQRYIRKIAEAFAMAFKNYLIYPKDHELCRRKIAELDQLLRAFFAENDSLRLSVEYNRLLFQETTVYEDRAKSGDLAALLFRDGIEWLEFKSGIQTDELTTLLGILKQNRSARQPDGDIVTALWEENLPHILYDATDVIWEDDPILDFIAVHSQPVRRPRTTDPDDEADEATAEDDAGPDDAAFRTRSIADPSLSSELWKLNPNDIRKIRKMVIHEEGWDETADVLDVLLIILEAPNMTSGYPEIVAETMGRLGEVAACLDGEVEGSLRGVFKAFASEIRKRFDTAADVVSPAKEAPSTLQDVLFTRVESEACRALLLQPEVAAVVEEGCMKLIAFENEYQSYRDILAFAAEEFQTILEQGEFGIGLNLLRSMREMRETAASEGLWTAPLIDDFFHALTGDSVLRIFCEANLEPLDNNQIRIIRDLLIELPHTAIRALGAMLPEISDERIGRMFTTVIGALAKRNVAAYKDLLAGAAPAAVERLLGALPYLLPDQAVDLLSELLTAPAEETRKVAMKHLLFRRGDFRDADLYNRLFPLIEDPNRQVRRMFLDFLAGERHPDAERLLLKHVKSMAYRSVADDRLTECFVALGRCGSAETVPFLERILLTNPWKRLFGKDRALRTAAALALMEIDSGDARKALDRAARSWIARPAYKRALEGKRAPEDRSNGVSR